MIPSPDAGVRDAAHELRLVLSRLIRKLRAEHGLPLSHGTTLARLEREGSATASALAAAEGVRPQSIANVVAELELQGLITRRADPEDGRQFLIEISPAGSAALRKERNRRDGWLAGAIADRLTEEEKQKLIEAVDLLEKLVTDGSE